MQFLKTTMVVSAALVLLAFTPLYSPSTARHSLFAAYSPRATTKSPSVLLPVNTFVVTNTDSNGPGSLRDAIEKANDSPGHDQIIFDIPGSGVQTLNLTCWLPDLTDNDGVTIDATTQGAFVELNGAALDWDSNCPAGPGKTSIDGFSIKSDNNVIRGFVINRFKKGAGIYIYPGFTNNVIVGNFIGTNPAGTTAKGNNRGIVVDNAHGNYIGGTAGTTPGGACTGDCNLISGNEGTGLVLDNGASENVVQGNYIGTNAAGTGAVPNGDNGLLIVQSSNNTIGGTTPQARNVISGNPNLGIEIGGDRNNPADNPPHDNLILGNYIGVTADGMSKLPNKNGIMFDHRAHDNVVGGSEPGAGNLISGNSQDGILIFPDSPRQHIEGNIIGYKADGSTPLGNGLHGIHIQSNDNQILNNLIGNNTRDGVRVRKGTGNNIRGNGIYNNHYFGINLGSEGHTPNDPGDGDTGPNNLQNFPVLSSAHFDGSVLSIEGTLNSKSNSRFELEFFMNPQCDIPPFGPSAGEGKVWLGTITVQTNGSGNASFTFFTQPGTASGVVTGTATDADGNTSEFSPCVDITSGVGKPPPPSLVAPENGSNVTENPPLLDWTASAGALKYKVLIKQGSTSNPIFHKNTNVIEDQYRPPSTLPADFQYFWRVKACNSAGCSRSAWFNFFVP